MKDHVKRIKRELVHKGNILDIYEDTMELPNGKTEKWDLVSHRMGAAAVVAVRDDGKVLMVRQYRNALERMTLEIPAGSRDSVTEDTRVCAGSNCSFDDFQKCLLNTFSGNISCDGWIF